MRRKNGFDHPVARRVAMASMGVLAASGIGLVAAPMAFGQIVIPIGTSQSAGVTNSGSASANSGGNTAVGNVSTNSATATNPGGGLVDVNLPVAAGPTNKSEGNASITSGAATATGNNAQTTVGQSNASGSQVNSFLAGQAQSAGVLNAGSASVGQAAQGAASGGLTPVGVGAIGGIGGAGVGAAPCSSGRFSSFQEVEVRNQGQAQANTGNNTAIGNASTNDAASNAQTVSGSLAGVGIQIGGPVNNSSGNAVITTGPATAVGNNSTTQVGQVAGCPQVATLTAAGRPGVIVPAGQVQVQQVRTAVLARTGLDTGDLGMIAGALLGAGMLLIASQRRRMAARSAAVPMAGFGFGLGRE